jgi:hypothetical protein
MNNREPESDGIGRKVSQVWTALFVTGRLSLLYSKPPQTTDLNPKEQVGNLPTRVREA